MAMADPKRTKRVLENLIASETLTEWEGGVVDSMAPQFDKGGFLSQAQLNVLENIYRQDNVRN